MVGDQPKNWRATNPRIGIGGAQQWHFRLESAAVELLPGDPTAVHVLPAVFEYDAAGPHHLLRDGAERALTPSLYSGGVDFR